MTVPSEKTQAKAAEYLLSSRIKITHLVTAGSAKVGNQNVQFMATAMSASQEPGDPYRVEFFLGEYKRVGWYCDCPARVPVCSHILACQTITDFPEVEYVEPEEPVGPPKPLARDLDLDAILGS